MGRGHGAEGVGQEARGDEEEALGGRDAGVWVCGCVGRGGVGGDGGQS